MLIIYRFGYGNHACPGRWLSVRLLKIMLCRLLLEYEIGWDIQGNPPADQVLEGLAVPSPDQMITVVRKDGK